MEQSPCSFKDCVERHMLVPAEISHSAALQIAAQSHIFPGVESRSGSIGALRHFTMRAPNVEQTRGPETARNSPTPCKQQSALSSPRPRSVAPGVRRHESKAGGESGSVEPLRKEWPIRGREDDSA